MDRASELERLRQKYGESRGADVHDPAFRRVAEGQVQGERRKQPYAGVATFMGLPHLVEGVDVADFTSLDVAVLGVPMDLGVTNRPGCRFGPRGVRQIERIGPYEHVLGVAPANEVKAADIGDVPVRSRFDLEKCHADIEQYYERIAAALWDAHRELETERENAADDEAPPAAPPRSAPLLLPERGEGLPPRADLFGLVF